MADQYSDILKKLGLEKDIPATMEQDPSQMLSKTPDDQLLNTLAQAEISDLKKQQIPSPEAPSEVDSLSKQISDSSPEKVKQQLKRSVMDSKPSDPYADIKAQLEALQKGSTEDLKSARNKDAILGFLNNMNKGLSRYDQAAASTGSRQAQQVMEALQVNPQFATQSKEDQASQYKTLMDKLGMKKEEQQVITTKESAKTQLIEKEKDRQLQRDLASQKAQTDIQEAMLKAKAKGGITKGQEALDKAYAKDYAEYVSGGGYAQAKGDIGRLEDVMKDIEKNKDIFTGPIDSLTESAGGFDFVRSITNPKMQDIKDRLEQIIQQDLRKTLGAQFTEKEGAQFLARSFNPKLTAEENVKRIKGFISDVKTRAGQKERAAKEFEQKGTLKDFKGEISAPRKEAQDVSTAPNEVERKTQDGKVAIFDAETKQFLRYK